MLIPVFESRRVLILEKKFEKAKILNAERIETWFFCYISVAVFPCETLK